MIKPIILVLIFVTPIVYYFEVERGGRWDITHIQDYIGDNFSSTTGYR
jgi:hypothetical protein